ncbi:lysylphosphatidylglycerol synthase domain-containing protein [Piscinibacter terrae]|uniref:UPF0104 family protein n=1 Tax=Piscinibacter terrae TaxID=2496871 RepID=A0A3N7HSV0_9BURK|nr:lysylphosphatidylglycerol synthase domain-containing protein [Albitalea terrae]RQP24326.1 UPF0104 family protein [Albitalea terrae]
MTRHALAERIAPPATPRPWWARLRRLLTIVFLIGVAALLVALARRVDWDEVWTALAAYPASTLAGAAGLAAVSHLVYSSFDLLGRAWTGHRLPLRQVLAVTSVSYAFNLSFGTLVGGLGFRWRLYSRLGLGPGDIGRILALSMATNWLGYLLVAGSVFAAGVIAPPPGWDFSAGAARVIGGVMALAALAYVVICAKARRREWVLRGRVISLPPARLAALQIALSSLNWMLMGGMLWVLLQGRVDYVLVLATLLAGALAGVLAHVPAGLGVLEAVFVTLLVPPLSRGEVLAALLAYRGIYYLAPLLIASGVYLFLEMQAHRAQATRD